MERKNFSFAVLSGNTLKLLAALFMLIDHVGLILFDNLEIMRVIGRLAYPIFAFMIAEGCRYTKNKIKYFGLVFGMGTLFQIVYYVFEKSMVMNIFITFSISILIVYALQFFKKKLFEKKSISLIVLSFLILACAIGVTYFLNKKVVISYGFWGCLLPAFASLFHADEKDENQKLLQKIDSIPLSVFMTAICIVLIAVSLRKMNMILQEYAIFAIPLLLLYSGKRGKRKMKYFFYLFFPIHLALLYGIAMLLQITYMAV